MGSHTDLSSQSDLSAKHTAPPFWGDLLLGYLLLGVQPVTVRALCLTRLSPIQAVFLRFAFGAVCIVVMCALRRRWISTKQPFWFFARGLLGAIAVGLYFTSVAEIGAARATLLNYTYPLWANLIALFFGSRPSRHFWIGLGFATLGVIIVIAPSQGATLASWGSGDGFGLLSAVVAGASVLVVKQLRKTDDALAIVGAFTVGGLFLSAWGRPSGAVLHTLLEPEWAWAAWGVGVSSFFGHVYFTRGYKGATVPQATLLSLIVPIVASALGVLFLNEPLGIRFWIGAVMVFASQVYVGQKESTQRVKVAQ